MSLMDKVLPQYIKPFSSVTIEIYIITLETEPNITNVAHMKMYPYMGLQKTCNYIKHCLPQRIESKYRIITSAARNRDKNNQNTQYRDLQLYGGYRNVEPHYKFHKPIFKSNISKQSYMGAIRKH